MMMPAKIGDTISWADVFVLRSKLDSEQPMHVQVQDVGIGVSHVRQRDELFLHEIKTDEISLKRYDTSMLVQESGGRGRKLSNPQDWTSSDLEHDLEIVLPLQYSERFILYPRFPLSHYFQTVREILDALPAVSKLIYPTEGFRSLGQSIRPMERLEIIDQVEDPITGSEMLCVRSMKTEERVLLYPELKISFIQLSNECYKCTSSGLPASDIVSAWKPGQAAFRVKLHLPRADREPENNLKLPKPKKDKKTKKHRSCDLENIDICDLSSQREDRWLIPRDWWNKMLLLKPYQKIRVKNIMFESRDFALPESAKLTVRLLSANTFSSSSSDSSVSEGTNRRMSGVEILSGFLRDLPDELFKNSKEPLLLMVTAGSMSVSLRQQVKITQGCRLAVHSARQTVKLLMTCSKAQKFLVSLTYAGLFKKQPDAKADCTVKSLLNDILPRDVEITRQDNSLGYDQLAKRTTLSVTEVLQETTLCVELISASGQKLLEQPFEIPLKRTNLFVQVIANKTSIKKLSNTDSMKTLPAVEFVSEADVTALRKNKKISAEDLVDLDEPTESVHSPEFPLLPLLPEVTSKFISLNDIVYATPDKTKKMNAKTSSILKLETTPPPRPPKSPNLMRKEPTVLLPAPERPPKPQRFKESHVSYFKFSNSNTNNNNTVNKEANTRFESKTAEDKRCDFRQNVGKNPHFLTWDPDISECTLKNQRLEIMKPPIPARTSSLDVCYQRDTKPGEETSEARGPVSKPNLFIKLHNMYDPFRAIKSEKLITIEQDDIKVVKHQLIDAFTDNKARKTPVNKGLLRDLKKVLSPTKLKNDKNMSNPNYDDKIELGNESELVDVVLQEGCIYDFAKDPLGPRKTLPSLIDDSDYEDWMAPPTLKGTSVTPTLDNEYVCTWGDERQFTKTRIQSSDSYEEPDYSIPE